MINISELPIDITEHIEKFRKFLNLTWDHVIYNIMDMHDWDDDGNFIDDWVQANWELLVERELLGENEGLSPYTSNPQDSKYLISSRKTNYSINVLVKNSQQNITECKHLRFLSFRAWDEKHQNYIFGPPFDFVRFVDLKTNYLYTKSFSKVKFILDDI